ETVQPLTLPAITSVTQLQQILCNGNESGSIPVVIDTTVGLGPYEIEVVSGTTLQNFGTRTSGLPAGDYEITVTDANMCISAVETITIDDPDAIDFDTAEKPITCDGDGVSAGEITVENVTGGVAPYTYHLSNNFGY